MRKILFLGIALACQAKAQDLGDQDLGNLGIEDLMKLQVTIASRQQESFKDVPAAIYVLTGEQIRKTGAVSLPEMLRMVPGLHIEQIDQSHWQVSIRGFGSRYSNKLQVLIDGRSIYTPLFSGVYWESNPVSPDEIERIEVVRGPGGALWGANAVNGVINVITRKPEDTQGGKAAIGVGDSNTAAHYARYGGKLGSQGFFRVYASYLGFKDLDAVSGGSSRDGWRTLFLGGRFDWKTSERDSFSVDGRLNTANMSQITPTLTYAPPFQTTAVTRFPTSDWSLNGSWRHQQSETGQSELRLSYSGSDHQSPEIGSKTSVLDIDYQQSQSYGEHSRLVWGGSYRSYSDRLSGSDLISSNSASHHNDVFAAYAEYEKPLSKNVKLKLGSTIEHNDYSGIEVQPSARLMWERNSKENYWISAARAVRTPSVADTDLSIHHSNRPGDITTGFLPLAIYLFGNPEFQSESVVSLELGSRQRLRPDLFVDLTAFYNSYDNLRSLDVGTPFMVADPVPHVVYPATFGNAMKAETGGIEAATTYQPNEAWRLDGSFSLFTDYYHFEPGANDLFGTHGGERQASTPRYRASIRSSHNLAQNLSLDVTGYYVGGVQSERIPAFARFDMRIGWKPNEATELSLAIQNLFDTKHQEAASTLFETPSWLRRSITAQLSWKF